MARREATSKRKDVRPSNPEPRPPLPPASPPARRPRALIAIGAGVVVVVALVLAARYGIRPQLESLPAPPPAGLSAAVAGHLQERYAAAMREPDAIAAVGPLCVAYHADMLYDLAERCYLRATGLEPDNWRWAYSRALILSERGGGEMLLLLLRQLATQAPRFGPVWLRLGDAEFKAANYDAAAEAWRRASELPDPSDESGASPPHVVETPLAAYANLGLARVALERGDADRARMTLEGVTTSARRFGPGYRLLAESYRALGRTADAERAVYRAGRLPAYSPYTDPIADALARESRNSTLLLRVASEASLDVNAAWSEQLSRRAVEFDPDNPEAVIKLARVLRTLDRNEEALPLFERYRTMVPGDMQALAHIASCLSAMGRYQEAETYLRQALTTLDDPVTHYNMGLLMSVTGRLDEAVKQYERALTLDPMHVDARGNLAIVLARQGRLDRAVRELMTLVERDPENASARTNLGLLLLQQGRAEQARPQLEEALRLDPTLAPAAEALQSIAR
jgi:tetratricopeptide (TPR) repeat protein